MEFMERLLENILLSGTEPHLEIDGIFLGNISSLVPLPFLSINFFHFPLTQMTQVPFNLVVSLEMKSYCMLFRKHTLWPHWGWTHLVPHPEIRSVHLVTDFITTGQTVCQQQHHQSTWRYLLPATAGPQLYLLSWTWTKSHCSCKTSVTQVDFYIRC